MLLLHWGWSGLVACCTGGLELVLRLFLLLGRRLVGWQRVHGAETVCEAGSPDSACATVKSVI